MTSQSQSPRPISNDTRDRTLASVDAVLASHREGDTLTAALLKESRERKLSPDIIRLVGRGINVAVANHTRETGTSLREKIGSRDVCDPEWVIEKLALEAERRTGTEARASASDAGGRSKIAAREAAPTRLPFFAKTAAETRPPIWLDPAGYTGVERQHAVWDLRRQTKAARMEIHWSRAKYLDRVKALFAGTRQVKAADLAAALSRVPAGLELAGEVADRWRNPIEANRFKAASLAVPAVITPEVDRVTDLLKQAVQAGDAVDRVARAAYKTILEAHYKAARITDPLAPPMKLAAVANAVEYRQAELEKFSSAATNALSSMFGATMGQRPPPPGAEDPAYRMAMLELQSPEQQAKLDRIRLRTSLQSLLESDPVLGSSDPSQVVQAFNQLAQSTPNLVNSPMLLGPALRRVVGGDLAPYDASALLEQEKNLRPTRVPATL